MSSVATERPTDEELVRLVAAGQVEVFAELYARYYTRAYRLAWAMTGQREVAEELTQEIFLRVWQKAGQFRGESKFGHGCTNWRVVPASIIASGCRCARTNGSMPSGIAFTQSNTPTGNLQQEIQDSAASAAEPEA